MTRLRIILLAMSPALLLACQLTKIGSSPTATPTPRPTRTPTPIEAQAVSPPTDTPPPPTATPAVTVMATTKENLRVRAAPSTSAQIVAQLKKGESVQVFGRTAASDWWQIALPSNADARGWISASFTTLSGPADSIPVLPANGQAPTAAPAAPSGGGAYPAPQTNPGPQPYPGPGENQPSGAYPSP